MVDLIAVPDPVGRARRAEELGADYITVHVAIDEQMRGQDPFAILQAVSQVVRVPVGVAGGINSETAAQAVARGASFVIVGGAITKAKDPSPSARRWSTPTGPWTSWRRKSASGRRSWKGGRSPR